MKPAYAPDKTRSSIGIICGLAIVVSLIAVLIGLSEKPQVDTIGITAGPADAEFAAAGAAVAQGDDETFGFDVTFGDDEGLESGLESGAESTSGDETGDLETTETDGLAPETTVIVVPTAAPTPTPEILGAVPPTSVPEQDEDADTETEVDPDLGSPGLPSSSGSVQGAFFTRPDEDEGAIVAQNLITVSFAEDGSGAFQGVLDITYVDGTHILLNMSGPILWTPSTPQVNATLSGAYTFDAEIDADDVSSDDAELSITSLEAGSGSLCTPKCFGFTFPSQG